jgi:DnaJ-class molecular chaperone
MGAVNPYRVLGLEPHASGGDIRRAYHTLALRYHPDIASDESGDRFVEIHEAYRLLRDPASRADYDRAHEQYAERRHRQQFAPAISLSSLFDTLLRDPFELLDFGDLGFVHEGLGRGEPEPIHYDLTLSPREAERGGRFRFAVPLRRPDRFVFEEREIEVAVPSGVRDGARAELAIDGNVLDVTVRIE